jgi:hypothetical protein
LKTAANTGSHKVLVAEIVYNIRNFVGHITNGSERLVDFGMVIGFLDTILCASLFMDVGRCIVWHDALIVNKRILETHLMQKGKNITKPQNTIQGHRFCICWFSGFYWLPGIPSVFP